MRSKWGFSLLLLVTYVALFAVWNSLPSRFVYLACGTLVFAFLLQRFRHAARDGYFINRVDRRLHILVLIDVFLETISFEAFRLFQPLAVAEEFHRNTNFVGCATAFTLLIGGYRYYALHRRGMSADAPSVMPLNNPMDASPRV